MPELLDALRGRLDESTIRGLSERLGSDPAMVRRVASMAVPMLIGGLSSNVHESPQARASLNQALERDHDGSLLDQLGSLLGSGGSGGPGAGGLAGGLAGALGGLLGGGDASDAGTGDGTVRRAADGEGILRHVLGDKRSAVEEGAARASGMDRAQVGRLLTMLAPLVLGALGKMKKERDLSADQVAEVVDEERRALERSTPEASEGELRHAVGSGSGEDLASLAGRLAGSFLGSGR